MGYENNEARKACIRAFPFNGPAFEWAIPPVLNPTTRLVVEMSAKGAGALSARGYESWSWSRLPRAATADFHLGETRMRPAA